MPESRFANCAACAAPPSMRCVALYDSQPMVSDRPSIKTQIGDWAYCALGEEWPQQWNVQQTTQMWVQGKHYLAPPTADCGNVAAVLTNQMSFTVHMRCFDQPTTVFAGQYPGLTYGA